VLRGGNQGAPDPTTGALGRADATQGIDDGAAHRGHVQHPDLSSRRFRQNTGSHPIEQNAILRLEHAAAENHFHIRPDEVQAADERTRHDGHFITEGGEYAHCYRVSGGRRLEQHGRKHAKSFVVESVVVDRDCDLVSGTEPEVLRYQGCQRGTGPSPVAVTNRGRKAMDSETVPTAEITGVITEREIPSGSAGWVDANRIDAGAGYDADSPRTGRTGAQHRERVVLDGGHLGERGPRQLSLRDPSLGRQVDICQAVHGARGGTRGRHSGLAQSLLDEWDESVAPHYEVAQR
jgi:hypothetical protein